jgi:TonB family protein
MKRLITLLLIVTIVPFQYLCNRKATNESKSENIIFVHGGALSGVRDRENVMGPILSRINEIKEIYSERQKINQKLAGEIVTEFKINALGNVISYEKLRSTITDTILENKVEKYIRSLQFNKIAKLDDTTDIVYPFKFKTK